MSTNPVATVFGGTRIGNRELFLPENSLGNFLDILVTHGVTTIDTAQSYGNSEDTLGHVNAGARLPIDSKWITASFGKDIEPWATKENIVNSAENSIQKLGVKQVYLPSLMCRTLCLITINRCFLYNRTGSN